MLNNNATMTITEEDLIGVFNRVSYVIEALEGSDADDDVLDTLFAVAGDLREMIDCLTPVDPPDLDLNESDPRDLSRRSSWEETSIEDAY